MSSQQIQSTSSQFASGKIFYNGYKAAFYSCSYPRKVLSSVNDAKKDLAVLTKAVLGIDQSCPSDWPKLSFGLTKAFLRIDQSCPSDWPKLSLGLTKAALRIDQSCPSDWPKLSFELTKAVLRIDQSCPWNWPKLPFGLTKAVLQIYQNQVKMTTERTPQSSEYLKKHTGVTELWPTYWQSKNTLIGFTITLWYIW